MTVFAYHLCRLIAVSYNPRKFGASENQKNRTLPLFLRTSYTAANGIRALLPSEVNDVITMIAWIRSIRYEDETTKVHSWMSVCSSPLGK